MYVSCSCLTLPFLAWSSAFRLVRLVDVYFRFAVDSFKQDAFEIALSKCAVMFVEDASQFAALEAGKGLGVGSTLSAFGVVVFDSCEEVVAVLVDDGVVCAVCLYFGGGALLSFCWWVCAAAVCDPCCSGCLVAVSEVCACDVGGGGLVGSQFRLLGGYELSEYE